MIKKKSDSFLMKLINFLLLVITFGQMKTFMSTFTTTIGNTIYIPTDWDSYPPHIRDCVLYHENIHVSQYKKEKFLYFFKYLFWPVPVFFAKSRLDYEIEAYAAEIAYASRTYSLPILPRIDHVVQLLSGPSYFWTCLDKRKIRVRLLKQVFLHILFLKANRHEILSY